MTASDDHPIRLVVEDDGQRSRLTVFFRFLLVIPHAILLALWALAATLAAFIAWGAGASFVRYATRVRAYNTILANPYPPFGSGGAYPIDVEIAPAATQSRLSIAFRLVLAIPAFILAYVFNIGLGIVALFGWVVSVITGRMPAGLEGLGTYCLRWETQTWAYLFLLTGRYPSLSGIS